MASEFHPYLTRTFLHHYICVIILMRAKPRLCGGASGVVFVPPTVLDRAQAHRYQAVAQSSNRS